MPAAKTPFIYLASQSHRRKVLLERMGVSFCTVPSLYKERMYKQWGPEELVMRHAMGKADKAILPKKAKYVLGSDTLVWCQGRKLGKPKSIREAKEMIAFLSGKTHSVFSGVAIMDRHTNQRWCSYDETKVTFKKLSTEMITHYVSVIRPLDKAGSYAIQKGPKIVRHYKGSYSNVMGLPVELLRKMLKALS